jgi:hypothetical protein
VIDGGCYYIQSTKQSSFEIAQSDCDTRFPNGGRLFEAQSLEMNEKVMIASRELFSSSIWFYTGIKRGETVGSDFKFFSSGITVPYQDDISGLENTNSAHQCVYVTNSLNWDDYHCNYSSYSICESK